MLLEESLEGWNFHVNHHEVAWDTPSKHEGLKIDKWIWSWYWGCFSLEFLEIRKLKTFSDKSDDEWLQLKPMVSFSTELPEKNCWFQQKKAPEILQSNASWNFQRFVRCHSAPRFMPVASSYTTKPRDRVPSQSSSSGDGSSATAPAWQLVRKGEVTKSHPQTPGRYQNGPFNRFSS